MTRSKLRNILNKRASENWQNYKQQRNIRSHILRSTRMTFFGNLNINETANGRKLWKIIKFFFHKCKTTNNIVLTEKNNSQSQQKEFQCPQRIFTYIAKSLNLR